MLELKAAPSPNPALPAAPAANAAAAPAGPGEGAGPEEALPHQGLSFAAVLKQHVGHGLEKKAIAPVSPLLAAQAAAATAAATAPAEEAPADPISLLAPMLAGIAVPAADATEPTETGVAAEPAVAALDAPVIAAPLTVTIAAPAAQQPTNAAPTPTPGPVIDNLPREGEKSLPAANIAAAAPANIEAEASATAGAQTDFDALLSVAKEAQVLANPQAPVRAPQAAIPAAASAPVATPMGAPGWGGEIGDKVVWMVGRQETRADLVLNPPQLGRIEVSLSMNGDQANATFISANASVREALENAMPRLREVLQNAGIALGQSQVGAESFQQSAEQRQTGDNQGRGHGRAADASQGLALGHDAAAGQVKRGNGLVDTFA